MKKHKKARTTQLLTMDELHARPCAVDGVPALFHRWIEEDTALLKINTFCRPEEMAYINRQFYEDGIIRPDCSAEVMHNTYALVEYPDGSVDKVKPELITFTDKESKT